MVKIYKNRPCFLDDSLRSYIYGCSSLRKLGELVVGLLKSLEILYHPIFLLFHLLLFYPIKMNSSNKFFQEKYMNKVFLNFGACKIMLGMIIYDI